MHFYFDRKEVDEIMEFIANSECRSAPVLPQKGIYLDKEWLQKLKSLYLKDMDETVYEPFDRQIWNRKSPVNCSPTTLFVVSFFVDFLFILPIAICQRSTIYVCILYGIISCKRNSLCTP